MRSRIPPALLVMALAASGPTPADHGIVVPAQPGGEPPRQKKQRKPQLSDREPRRSSRRQAKRAANLERQQAAAAKRSRKAQARLMNQMRTAYGQVDAHNEIVGRERHEKLYGRRGRTQ